MNIDDTLKDRGNKYGTFQGNATIAQELKAIWKNSPAFPKANAIEREGMEMILHKISRICNGDPHYDDSWVDIAGYAQLVVKYINSYKDVPNQTSTGNVSPSFPTTRGISKELDETRRAFEQAIRKRQDADDKRAQERFNRQQLCTPFTVGNPPPNVDWMVRPDSVTYSNTNVDDEIAQKMQEYKPLSIYRDERK